MEYKKDNDGNFILDEQGNKVHVEITDDANESDKKIAAALAPVVEELKELRAERSLLKDMLKAEQDAKNPPTPPAPATEDDKIAAAVKKALDAEKSSDAQANKKAAFDKFVSENKQFHPENDTLGLKRKALEDKFNRFNTEGLNSVEEFISVIGDAKDLLVKNGSLPATNEDKTFIPQAPLPRTGLPAPKDGDLSDREKKLMEKTGRTKEQILKMKEKHPDMLRDLLEFVSDN